MSESETPSSRRTLGLIVIPIALAAVILLILKLDGPAQREDPLAGLSDPYDLSDAAWKKRLSTWSERDLHSLLVDTTASQLKDMENPEIPVLKALISEALTRFDPERGTNHWDRAAVHYEEGIELWEKIDDGKNRTFIQRRILRLWFAHANCLEKQGKTEEARKVREAHGLQVAPAAPAPAGPPEAKVLPNGDVFIGEKEKK